MNPMKTPNSMKNSPSMNAPLRCRILLAVAVALLAPCGLAQLAIPSDGSDGVLNLTSGINVIDLRQAVSGVWSNSNTNNAGKGIYDPAKWAVVFKYSSVFIGSNATVVFSNNISRAPVVWLVSSNVTINGTLNLDGQSWNGDRTSPTEPGPGGFRGGMAGQAGFNASCGFGPGGFNQAYGSYSSGLLPYGSPQIVPVIGGSGGSGNGGGGGGAGGGAILIAASGTIVINGYCHANGGNADRTGSGGAVRLVANQILGSGRIEAITSQPSTQGRIRLEANTASGSLLVNPGAVVLSPTPLVIWPDASAPMVQVISVAGQPAPATPTGAMSAAGDDMITGTTNAVTILLQTANFPTNGTVNVFVKNLYAGQNTLQAGLVSGNASLATWQVTTILPVGHNVIQAHAVPLPQ